MEDTTQNNDLATDEKFPLEITKDLTLSGKTVVITGASSGVGRAAAEAFALEGCRLVLAARGEEALKETVDLCHDLGAIAMGVPTDVSKEEDVKNLVDKALEYNGRIDYWINNAGVMASGKFEEIPMETQEQVIKTNLFGYMYSAYNVLPIFKRQNEGVLINNVSIGAFMPAPYSAAYSASKRGIAGLMETLQGEISNFPNIHISNIYPQIQKSTGNSHSAKYSGLDFKIPPMAADPRNTAKKMVELAKNPRRGMFPDTVSYLLKTAHSIMPSALVNTASAGMRMVMKLKNAPDNPGNVLESSNEPHRIYGETALPSPSKNVKNALLAGIGLGFGYMLLTSKKSKKKN